MVKLYIRPGREWLKPIIEDALVEYELIEEIDLKHLKPEVFRVVEKQKKHRLMNKSNGVFQLDKAKQNKNGNIVQHSEDTGHNSDETTEAYASGQNPNSLGALENYKWKPGQSGNPGGRPKRSKILQEAFKNKLSEVIEEDGPDKGKKIAEAISDMAWDWLQKAKTVSEFSSLLSQVRETCGERAQKDDMPPGENVPFVVLLPQKNYPAVIEATVPQIAEAEVIDDGEEN